MMLPTYRTNKKYCFFYHEQNSSWLNSYSTIKNDRGYACSDIYKQQAGLYSRNKMT